MVAAGVFRILQKVLPSPPKRLVHRGFGKRVAAVAAVLQNSGEAEFSKSPIEPFFQQRSFIFANDYFHVGTAPNSMQVLIITGNKNGRPWGNSRFLCIFAAT